MAIHLLDGVELYSSTLDADISTPLALRYATIAGVIALGAGRYSGKSLYPALDGGTDHSSIIVGLTTDQSTLVFGFAVKFKAASAGTDQAIVEFLSENGLRQVALIQQSTANLSSLDIYIGGSLHDSFNTGGTTDWIYLEVKLTIDAVNGEIIIKANGEEVFNEGSLDTTGDVGSLYVRSMRISTGKDSGAINGYRSNYYDDIYIADDFITNATFCTIEGLLPTSVDAHTDWTGSAGGDKNLLVDEITPNGDTDYVSSAAAGNMITFGFGNLSRLYGDIKAISLLPTVKNDATPTDLQLMTTISSTDYTLGSVFQASAAYATLPLIQDISPDTSAAWDLAELNAAAFGIEQDT